ncbi:MULTISPECIES: beta-phosphoglucomutase [Exiguobacterium]|uniref:Beta-phosphoglucomutase n=1 Tax=Exiguobacterium sibiricum (strain DSM 17290 / CCUG 55495 / CIP 109462 / JCM 13490 / 255-15) TaxID=262543 RepID=B1YLM3_EXIS2|nr:MULTISPECIES: beta-phosphoglucomutase [Exiguobacterium]ACB61928.1 beta-phosphoglucomutase [Exiguobacterium sibiricum 255-15]MCT4792106.1 beta-phosphoglucomutase [Exiguobacterium artemiae]
MAPTIEAVIFDLDGVITDTAEYHYLAWKQLGEELDIPFDREFNETLKGVSRTDSLERILILGGKQDAFTAQEKEALATKKNDHYVTLIQHISEQDLLPGIIAFLDEIRATGLKIGMASASKNALTVVEALGVRHYFDDIVDAATVAQSKPHPEVFLRAAEALGVAPERCIGVEDAAAGITAIHAAGMYAVGVGPETTLHEADYRVDSTDLLSLEQILASR